jgi:hypothetical protein
LLKIERLRLIIASRVKSSGKSGYCKINILLKLLHILFRSSQPSLLPLILLIKLENLLFPVTTPLNLYVDTFQFFQFNQALPG